MAFNSVKNLFATVVGATPGEIEELRKAWQVAADNGSQESLLAFLCRERGLAEELFLQRLAAALNWPFLDLPKLTVQPEARNRISTKVAFQYSVLPTAMNGAAVQVAVSN